MFRIPFQATCITILLAVPAALAQAKVCLYQDADGHMTYSNVTESPPKGAKKIRCFDEPKSPRAEDDTSSAGKPAARNSDSDAFPKVDGNTQRRRDDERRRILEDELATEQQRLDQARKELTEQESVRTGGERNYQRFLDRVQPFRDAVENHERNIQAIQRELANMR